MDKWREVSPMYRELHPAQLNSYTTIDLIESGIGSLNEKRFLILNDVKISRMSISVQKRFIMFVSLRCVCRE